MRKLLFATSFSGLVLLVYLFLSLNQLFVKLRVPVMSPSFGDLRLITATADCIKQNDLWTLNSPSCDPWKRPFNLPSIWAKIFGFLNLTQDKTESLGYFFVLLFCLAISYWILKFLDWSLLKGIIGKSSVILLFLLFVSPPVLLLIERGNVDIPIFLGMTISVYLFGRHEHLSMALLTALGALKLFPWGGLVLLFRKGRSLRVIVAYSTIVVCLIFLLFDELKLIKERSTTDFNGISYGVSIIPEFIYNKIGQYEKFTQSHILGLLIFSAIFFTLKYALGKSLSGYRVTFIASLKSNPAKTDIFLITGSVFLATYLVGTSYDYRLVFLIPVTITLASCMKNALHQLLTYILAMFIFYNSYWFNPIIGLLSDVSLLFLTPLIAVLLTELLKDRDTRSALTPVSRRN